MGQFCLLLLERYPASVEPIRCSLPGNTLILNSHLKNQRAQIIYV